MALKIKWKVADKPTGTYSSFQYRAWPSGSINDKPVAYMAAGYVDDTIMNVGYTAALAKNVSCGYAPAHIIVRVADYNGDATNPNASFRWRLLKARFQSVDEAKAAVLAFFEKNPSWLPKEKV